MPGKRAAPSKGKIRGWLDVCPVRLFVCLSAMLSTLYLLLSIQLIVKHRRTTHKKEDLRTSQAAPAVGVDNNGLQAAPVKMYGNLNWALYRFSAEKLGPQFAKAIQEFDAWIGDNVDDFGGELAANRTSLLGPRQFFDECYERPDEEHYLELEALKKNTVTETLRQAYNKTVDQSRNLKRLYLEHKFFYRHKLRQNHETPIEPFITPDRKWAWRTAAVFSAQHAGRQSEFREGVEGFTKEVMEQAARNYFKQKTAESEDDLAGDELEDRIQELAKQHSVSGTFWYPPNGIREWHTNVHDFGGKTYRPWRMYYVRTKHEESNQESDGSAMHLMNGPGLPPDRLTEMGAYPVQGGSNQTQDDDDDPQVWRIPDRDGYVSLFRLQEEPPFRWHCITSGPGVHRYSLGMKLSDEAVEALLTWAGVPL